MVADLHRLKRATPKKIPRDQRLLSAISALSAAENNPKRVLLASHEIADLWRINVSIPVDFEKSGAFDSFMQKTESSEGAREREEHAKSAVQFASNPNQIFRAAFLAFDPLQANLDNDFYLALALAHVNTLESESKKNQVNNACRARGMDPTSLDDLVKAFTSDSAGQDPGNPEEGNGMRYPPPQHSDPLAMSLSSKTSSIIETPTSMSSEFSSNLGSEYSVGLVNSSPSTGTRSTSLYGGTSAGLDIESMQRIMGVDKRNWRQHYPDTYDTASKFLQREKIRDGNTLNERAKTVVKSFTDCIERERYDPQFIDKMYALSEVFLNADTGIQLDSKNALRAADGMCKMVTDCRILDAARRSCFFMQRAKIAAKEDRAENALSLGAAAVMQAQQKGVSESHLHDVLRVLIAIPNVRWPEAYKWHAAKDAPLRQRWFVNMEVADDDRISSDARMLSAIAALHDANDNTQRLVASQKVNELWDDEVARPEYSVKKNAYEEFINQANLEPDEVKRVECAKNAVRFALSPQKMFDAAIHVVNNARRDDDTFEYYLALAHLSTQNEPWRKHLVDAACFKRGISTTNLDEYVKSYTRDFTGLGYGNSMEMQSVRYPPAAHTQAAPAIGMGNSAPESSYGRPGPPAELRARRAGVSSEMLRRSKFRDLITRPPGPDNGRGRGRM
jgi:hypothetical protein